MVLRSEHGGTRNHTLQTEAAGLWSLIPLLSEWISPSLSLFPVLLGELCTGFLIFMSFTSFPVVYINNRFY